MAEGNKQESERKLLEGVLNSAFIEQRRSRRWGIFFKFLTLGYLIALLLIFVSGGDRGAVSTG